MVMGSVRATVPAVLTSGAVKLKAPCLALNADQSAEESSPRFVTEAVGMLNVWVLPLDTIPKSVPVVPVAKVWVDAVRPLRLVIKPPAVPSRGMKIVNVTVAGSVPPAVLMT